MSVTPSTNSKLHGRESDVTDLQKLHDDENFSFLKFLNLQEMSRLAITSTRGLYLTTRYICSYKPHEVKVFINNLMAELSSEQLKKSLGIEKYQQQKIKLEETINKLQEIKKKTLEEGEAISLFLDSKLMIKSLISCASGILGIKKSILVELIFLDESILENLKKINTPSFFEDIFKIVELFNKVKNNTDPLPALQDAVINGELDIVIEVVHFMHPESSKSRDEVYYQLGLFLVEKKEPDKAFEFAKIIFDNDKYEDLVFKTNSC